MSLSAFLSGEKKKMELKGNKPIMNCDNQEYVMRVCCNVKLSTSAECERVSQKHLCLSLNLCFSNGGILLIKIKK